MIQNDRAFAVFETLRRALRAGGALRRRRARMALAIVGAPFTNPSSPGEEELTGPAANRCSAFKDMNGGSYADAAYAVVRGRGRLALHEPRRQGGQEPPRRRGGDVLHADYQETVAGPLYVRLGLSPNPLDLMQYGEAHLVSQFRSAENAYWLVNTAGGGARLDLGGATFIAAPADAGWNRRNLALTEEVEVAHDGDFTLALRLIPGEPAVSEASPSNGRPPQLAASGPFPSPSSGAVRLTVWLAQAAAVRCDVVDAAGRRVVSTDLGVRPAGALDVGLEPRAGDGTPLPAGVYFVRVTAGAASAERRWVLLHP